MTGWQPSYTLYINIPVIIHINEVSGQKKPSIKAVIKYNLNYFYLSFY